MTTLRFTLKLAGHINVPNSHILPHIAGKHRNGTNTESNTVQQKFMVAHYQGGWWSTHGYLNHTGATSHLTTPI